MGFSLRNLFKNAAKILVSNIGISGLAFLQGVLVARVFGPSTYGVWGIIVAYCGTAKAFLSFRTAEPLTRYLVEFQKEDDRESIRLLLSSGLWAELGTSLLTMAVILLAAP